MNLQTVQSFYKSLNKKVIESGIVDTGISYVNGQSVMEVAKQHEFGNGKVPMRSFLALPILLHEDELRAHIKKAINYAVKINDADIVHDAVGLEMMYLQQNAFPTEGYGYWQKLSMKSLKAKGAGKALALTDTGALKGAISYVNSSGASSKG
jgi:hypothetical protein